MAIDLAFWQSIKDSTQASDFEDYITRFPNGQFVSLAKRRLAGLKPEDTTTPTPQTSETVTPQPKPAEVAQPDPKPAPVKLPRNAARDLQARLNILGFNAGVEDGLVGRKTLRAVAGYKSARGLAGGAQIDAPMLARIARDVPESRLAAHRDAARAAAAAAAAAQAAAKPKAQSNTTSSRPNTQPQSTTKTTAPAPTPKPSNFASYAGRTFCRRNGGAVYDGCSLTDRPIDCVTVLSVSGSKMRYRWSRRHQYGQALEK